MNPLGLESRWLRWLLAIIIVVVLVVGKLGYLQPLRAWLDVDALSISVGNIRFTAYRVLEAIFAVLAIFWLASVISATGERRLKAITYIQPGNKALIVKIWQIFLYLVVFFTTMKVLGIDWGTLAVLGGALGIGIGFGLQKIASNFISGLILLFEKSVEEGDLVEMNDGVYGYLRHTGARYSLVETFDGKEVMIPNEDFITNRVVNWTYSNARGRAEVRIGVAYDSDIEKVMELMLGAAKAHPRCSVEPAPQCYLQEFGDNSVNFLLYFWVDDVTNGRFEPMSDVMRTIWHEFKKHNISIPFPQRDIHIKSHINHPEALR